MSKIAIIGAGIAGLSLGRMLEEQGLNYKIFEVSDMPGGIARPKDSNGIPYHLTGGHCFNSKYQDVLEFVFKVLPRENWNMIDRNAVIKIAGGIVEYPLELNLSQLSALDKELAIKCVRDFLTARRDKPAGNLEEFFVNNFGNGLSEAYLLPYNAKIWGRPVQEMSADWVEDKLPMPDVDSFIESLLRSSKDKMPHRSFYYPKAGSQSVFIDALANGLNIVYGRSISGIEKVDEKYGVNGELYDIVVNTSPLKQFVIGNPGIFSKSLFEDARRLQVNGITNMLWKCNKVDFTWKYDPSEASIFHRYIYISNFQKRSEEEYSYVITEAVGTYSIEEMKAAGSLDPELIEALDYNYSPNAYVVFNEDTAIAKSGILESISKERGLFTTGRFGSWDYYNMDIVIKESMKIFQNIIANV